MKYFLIGLIFISSAYAKTYKVQFGPKERQKMVIQLPRKFKKSDSWPIIVNLHGYKGTIGSHRLLTRLGTFKNKKGYILVTPSGVENSKGMRFWNASRYCCDFEETRIDDQAYIESAIEYVNGRFGRVDFNRIYLVGHSNGGFMAYKMACDSKYKIAGMINLAGSTDVRDDDEILCPHRPALNVVHIHGTKDGTISFDGWINDETGVGHLSAEKSAFHWAQHNNCQTKTESQKNINADIFVWGKEAKQTTYSNCEDNRNVTLFTLEGSPHVPFMKFKFISKVLDLMMAP